MDGQQDALNKGISHQTLEVARLESIFNDLFKCSEATILRSGAEEPLYFPASETGGLHTIFSTRDYVSSALHEISHWCIAGEARRQLVDYGYWYEPDGRTAEQQHQFERVEVKPQALEWLFTEACAQVFRLSVDNINQPDVRASAAFRNSVHAQALFYLERGLPDRAERFLQALLVNFRSDKPVLEKSAFQLSLLN